MTIFLIAEVTAVSILINYISGTKLWITALIVISSSLIYTLYGGLRASMGYTGCKNLEDFQTKTNFIKITAASLNESHTHDVVVTREAPNYPTRG